MAKRQTTRSRRIPLSESFLFHIESFDPHYSFTTNDGLRGDGPFAEYLHPEIMAVCLAPAKLKGRMTRMVFIGNRDLVKTMQDPSHSRRTGRALVGTLTMRGQQSDYLGSLPFDAALALGPMLATQAIRYVYLSGDPLFRGTADIRSSGFYREFDVNDL